jgi:hypothetical protein
MHIALINFFGRYWTLLNLKNSVDYTGPAESHKRQGFQQFRSNCSVFGVNSPEALPYKAFSLPDHFNCGF